MMQAKGKIFQQPSGGQTKSIKKKGLELEVRKGQEGLEFLVRDPGAYKKHISVKKRKDFVP